MSYRAAHLAVWAFLLIGADSARAAPYTVPVPLPRVLERVSLPALKVPLLLQVGERHNCGPTAAAMVLAAYQQLGSSGEARQLRDVLGDWSWEQFPLRRFRLPGHPAGLSTLAMVRQMLNRFGPNLHFEELRHSWLPGSLWPALTLGPTVAQGRPVITLVQSSTLWGNGQPGLHWVVVVRVGDETLTFNDPSDSTQVEIPLDQFYQAWQLDPLYRGLPMVGPFQALVADRPLPGFEIAPLGH